MSTRFFFNDLEAFKIAIDIEKSGERFYIKAANRIEEASIRDMLLELAHQEREHADTFERLYNQTAKEKDELDDTYLFEPEISQYLAAIVQTTVFPGEEKQDEVLTNNKDVEDVLKIGIQDEKESILFYTEMIIYSKLVDAKEAFRKLVKEEKKHLIDLQTALNSLRDKK